MQQSNSKQNLSVMDAAHFSTEVLFSEEETMGQIVVEILTAGRNLNRKALCDKLLNRIETAKSGEQEKHYLACLRVTRSSLT